MKPTKKQLIIGGTIIAFILVLMVAFGINPDDSFQFLNR